MAEAEEESSSALVLTKDTPWTLRRELKIYHKESRFSRSYSKYFVLTRSGFLAWWDSPTSWAKGDKAKNAFNITDGSTTWARPMRGGKCVAGALVITGVPLFRRKKHPNKYFWAEFSSEKSLVEFVEYLDLTRTMKSGGAEPRRMSFEAQMAELNRRHDQLAAEAAKAEPSMVRTLPDVRNFPDESYPVVPAKELGRIMSLKQKLSEIESLGLLGLEASVAEPGTFSEICIVGPQSSGKSTLLEYLTGAPCAYRKAGMGTTRPLVYRIVADPMMPADTIEFSVALDEGGSPSPVSPARLREVLYIRQTQPTSDPTKRDPFVSSDPITIDVRGPNLFTITIVDLPGYIDEGSDPEQKKLAQRIRQMNNERISKPDSLLLAVRTSSDWEGSNDRVLFEVLESIDPGFTRTVCCTNFFSNRVDNMPRASEIQEYSISRTATGAPRIRISDRLFFLDVLLELKPGASSMSPVPLPEKGSLAHGEEATVKLHQKVLEKYGHATASELRRRLGVSALREYIRYCVVGDGSGALERLIATAARAKRELSLAIIDLEKQRAEEAEPATMLSVSLSMYVKAIQVVMQGIALKSDGDRRTAAAAAKYLLPAEAGLTTAEEREELAHDPHAFAKWLGVKGATAKPTDILAARDFANLNRFCVYERTSDANPSRIFAPHWQEQFLGAMVRRVGADAFDRFLNSELNQALSWIRPIQWNSDAELDVAGAKAKMTRIGVTSNNGVAAMIAHDTASSMYGNPMKYVVQRALMIVRHVDDVADGVMNQLFVYDPLRCNMLHAQSLAWRKCLCTWFCEWLQSLWIKVLPLLEFTAACSSLEFVKLADVIAKEKRDNKDLQLYQLVNLLNERSLAPFQDDVRKIVRFVVLEQHIDPAAQAFSSFMTDRLDMLRQDPHLVRAYVDNSAAKQRIAARLERCRAVLADITSLTSA